MPTESAKNHLSSGGVASCCRPSTFLTVLIGWSLHSYLSPLVKHVCRAHNDRRNLPEAESMREPANDLPSGQSKIRRLVCESDEREDVYYKTIDTPT
jgi:hypothetical protein